MTLNSQTLDVSIRCEVLDGTWETFGVDRDVEVLPETVRYESDEWGPLKASFVLRRNPWAAWPDLSPDTPVEIEIGGVLVWEGRTSGTPVKAGAERQISVQCNGWQVHLDDDLYKRMYVHATLTDWKDVRGSLEAQLATWIASPQIQVETGVIALTYPTGSVPTANSCVGAYIGLGDEAAGKVIAVRFGESNYSAGYFQIRCRAAASVAELTAGPYEELFGFDPASPSTHVSVAAAPRRYIAIFIERLATATGPLGHDETLKISGISIFSEEAYEDEGVSALKASWVLGDALTHAPLLSGDHSQIAEAEDLFNIPALVMSSYKTPRQMIEAVNAFHNWVTQIDPYRRMVFKPPSSEPLLEWGSWSGEESEDASAGQGEEIFNRIVAEGTAANGEPLDVTAEASGSVVSQRGFRRSKALSMSNAMTTVVGEKLAQVYLDEHQITPYSGSIRANVGSLRTVLGGQPLHPSLLCRHVNELLRVGHAIDPDTGGVGRDARIVAIVYEHATQSAQISLGSRTDSYDALMERLAVVESVGS